MNLQIESLLIQNYKTFSNLTWLIPDITFITSNFLFQCEDFHFIFSTANKFKQAQWGLFGI